MSPRGVSGLSHSRSRSGIEDDRRAVVADGLGQGIRNSGQDREGAEVFARRRVAPFVPNPGEGERTLPVAGVDDVRLGQLFALRPFDERVGHDEAALRPNRLPKHRLVEDAHRPGVGGVVDGVAVALRPRIDHVVLLFRPSRREPKLHELHFARAVARDDRRTVAVADVGVGRPRSGCLDVEALFNGLDGRDGDVTAAHGSGGLEEGRTKEVKEVNW